MEKYYYFDNSATSNPKPETVYKSVNYAMKELNSNPGRGGHRLAVKSASEIYKVREKVAKFFNLKNSLGVGFTNNSTTALNYAINSLMEKNSIIGITEIEHNSVLRPLYTQREEKNLNIIRLSSDRILENLLKEIERLKKENKKFDFLVLNHMSNVTGYTIDLEKVGIICKEQGIKLVVDVSQSAGVIPIDMEKMNIDILAFTGHKSLYSIQGVGGICVKDEIKIKPLICGGTGSHSRVLTQPNEMPEVVEGGTVNTPGIISLGAGLDFIKSQGLDKIYNHELKLKKIFLEGLEKINKNLDEEKKIKIYTSDVTGNGPVVSINISGLSSSDLSYILDEDFGIITRSGLHCAPLIHEKNGTEESGATRFSFGFFNTESEVIYAVDSILKIIQEL